MTELTYFFGHFKKISVYDWKMSKKWTQVVKHCSHSSYFEEQQLWRSI